MNLDFTPNVLQTPLFLTPNLTEHSLVYKPSSTSVGEMTNETTINSTSTKTTTTTTCNESSEDKVSTIKNDLKQSLPLLRRPTESPFFPKHTRPAGATIDKTLPQHPATEDAISTDIPSTAEVVRDILSFEKYPTKENIEREIDPMGVNVSPKKRFIFRSQSRTDVTSPSANPSSQSQRNQFDEETFIDDNPSQSIAHHFQRAHDVPLIASNIELSSQPADHNLETSYPVQIRAEPTIHKPQLILVNNKRPLQARATDVLGTPIIKTSSSTLAQPPLVNEVTSSAPLIGIKRQKLIPTSGNTLTFHSSSPAGTDPNMNNHNLGSDIHRKQQIRDSNREAARRCRERRRQYIEQLEGNLEQHKTQIKQLTEKLSRAERENTQLRAILSEANMFQSRRSSNESLDYPNMISLSNVMDGNPMQRNYITRSTH